MSFYSSSLPFSQCFLCPDLSACVRCGTLKARVSKEKKTGRGILAVHLCKVVQTCGEYIRRIRSMIDLIDDHGA